ncbi:hypothetical protein VPFG_00144 [Vibrio phage nt-1]|uniref:Uncharacterized protein n=1 Tax=Vibrio phage nt-1 TaxID=115992 RepID=R9TEG6_9CAUD|nr:hypothetical protein VPFG_00144 [Vibrio phage nt-1]AGN30146.1 hypothetical protein VPFG_00144 [Vibrio phage nt-1]
MSDILVIEIEEDVFGEDFEADMANFIDYVIEAESRERDFTMNGYFVGDLLNVETDDLDQSVVVEFVEWYKNKAIAFFDQDITLHIYR